MPSGLAPPHPQRHQEVVAEEVVATVAEPSRPSCAPSGSTLWLLPTTMTSGMSEEREWTEKPTLARPQAPACVLPSAPSSRRSSPPC